MIKIDFKQRKREVLWTVVALFFISYRSVCVQVLFRNFRL